MQSVLQKADANRPEKQWRRAVRAFQHGPLTSRQLAGPPVYASAGHSLVAELRSKRLEFDVEMVVVTGFGGVPTRIAKYTLRPESRQRAEDLLAGRR
jgi:hypothetical protein